MNPPICEGVFVYKVRKGNFINLSEPNIESIKKNLTYIRAEADALALEFRFHSKKIHNNFIKCQKFISKAML